MNLSRTNRWTIRAFGAVLLFLLTLATSGVVQAITGAGTPCNSCGARCYQYYAGIPIAQGGCKLPSGMPDTACLGDGRCSQNPGAWCEGCINTAESYVDCESENCWFENINDHGGNLCSNGCYGAGCASGSRTCGQVQQQCGPENSSVACSKCGCQP